MLAKAKATNSICNQMIFTLVNYFLLENQPPLFFSSLFFHSEISLSSLKYGYLYSNYLHMFHPGIVPTMLLDSNCLVN